MCLKLNRLTSTIKAQNIIVGLIQAGLSPLRTGPHPRGIGMAAIPKM